MPHDKIEALRNELAHLKGERKATEPQSRDVLEAMQNLTETLDHFMELFQAAIEEMKIEEREEELIVTELRPLHEKLDQILDQNQRIAEGIIAIADLIKNMKDIPKPIAPAMPQFPPPGSRIPPRQQFGSLPPLPPMPRLPPLN